MILVTPQWITEQRANSNLVLLDASIDFQIPLEPEKDTVNVIPGARRFDYDRVFCDQHSPLPHMMPSEAEFNAKAQALGLNQNSVIVVYDNSGTFASPRAWWMLKAMGHEQVYILDGGLPQWKAQGYDVSQSYASNVLDGDFNGQLSSQHFISADEVLAAIDDSNILTVDARSMARFSGSTPEPREGLRSGHIPKAVCLPFAELISGGRLKPVAELKPIVTSALGDSHQHYIFSCGSGVTACIVLLAAMLCGYENLSVYDGSWTEWGCSKTLPIETQADA